MQLRRITREAIETVRQRDALADTVKHDPDATTDHDSAATQKRTQRDPGGHHTIPDEVQRYGNVTPNHLLEHSDWSRSLIYLGPGQLFLDQVDRGGTTSHQQFFRTRQGGDSDGLRQALSKHGIDPTITPDDFFQLYQRFLFGRLGELQGQRLVSFWGRSTAVLNLVPGCLRELARRGVLTPDTIVIPGDGHAYRASDSPQQPTQADPAALARQKLQLQLHTATGARKDAIRRMLGQKKPPARPHPMQVALRQQGLLSPGQSWRYPNSESLEQRLGQLFEAKRKEFFDYQPIAKEHWRQKLREAQDERQIEFDSENDDEVVQRTIKAGDCRFRCELRLAGGDWQAPTAYFRCQLVDGYVKGLSKYDDPYFCVIPGQREGNRHLSRGKHVWAPASADDKAERPDERRCWQYLQRHLNELVD